MHQQVVASGCKLNLHWVAKWTRMFPCKDTQVTKKKFKANYPLFHRSMDITQLALT